MALESYEEFRESLSQADLRLKELYQSTSTPRPGWCAWNLAQPRVVVLHRNENHHFGPATEYHNSERLRDHLNQQINNTAQCSVYILESLCPKFAEVLGLYFQLHPTLFMDHERLVPFRGRSTGEGGGISFLPSAIHGREYVSLKYHEPLSLSPLPTAFRNLCDISGRHVAVTRINGKFCDVGVARRKCTFWSRKTELGGWDCVIVCDPPIKRLLTDHSNNMGYNITTSPYNNGYLDFMPHGDQIKFRSGPPRTSMLEDVVFYIQTRSQILNLDDPNSLRIFVERIACSHYLKLTEFLGSLIEKKQFKFSRQRDFTGFAIAAVEEQWSDVQALERRIGEYRDDLEAIMLQLRIPFEEPRLFHNGHWTDCSVDFQYLWSRIRTISHRVNGLNASTASLASLIDNRQAYRAQQLALDATERQIREARSVKTLTILGMIFIPLTYVAALFSMPDPYRPGGKFFGVYFAVSLPLIGLILIGYKVWGFGYVYRRVQQSLRTVIDAVFRTGQSRHTPSEEHAFCEEEF